MGTETTNYNLYKPTPEDEIEWGDEVNLNFDTIDSELKKKEAKVNTVKVDSPDFTDNNYIEFDVTGSTITAQLSTAEQTKVDNGATAYGWGNHADANYLSSVSTDITASGNGTPTSPLSFNQPLGLGVDGGSTAITTGEKNAQRRCVKAGTITGWSLDVKTSATITVDVYKNGSKVSGTGSPAITAGKTASSTDLSGWTDTTFARGDLFTINVTANDNATWLGLTMEVQ
jgi:hypothetical protein